jgi:hypothetical protein
LVDAIRPVVMGILVGAGLSILNQFFLQVAESMSDALRERARAWFDDRIWPKVVTREESTNRLAAESLERTAAQMSQFARMHRIGAEAAIDATGVIERAADVIRQAVAEVSTEWRSSVDILAKAGRAVERATFQFRGLIPDGGRVVDRMVNSVDRFGEIVEARFAERVRLQEHAANQLAQSAATLEAVVSRIEGGTASLMDHCHRQREVGERYLETLEQVALPNQEAMATSSIEMRAAVDGLKDRVGGLDDALRVAAEALTAATPEFRRVFGLVETTAGQLRSVVETELTSAARKHNEILDEWSGFAESTGEMVRAIVAAAQPLESIIDGFRRSSDRLEKTIADAIEPANVRLLDTATTLAASSDRLTTGLDAMDRSLVLTTRAFATLTETATRSLDGLAPPLERFHTIIVDQLAPAAERQEHAAGLMIAAFHQVRDSAEWLGRVTESIRELAARQLDDTAASRAASDAILVATGQLTRVGDVLKSVLSEDLPPLEIAIRDALTRLRDATEALGGFVVDGGGRLEHQMRGLEASLGRVQDLIESLRPIVVTEPKIAGTLNGLNGHFDRLTDGIATLSARLDEVAQHRRKGFFGH